MPSASPGRRRDEILRVIDDDPRILGFRARSLVFPLLVGLLLGSLYSSRLLSIVFGDGAGIACVVGLALSLIATKYLETLEDELFLIFTIRYCIRRVASAWKGRYSGAAPCPRRPHVLDDVLTLARVSRFGGMQWDRP